MNEPILPPLVPALEHATHAVALWIEHAFSDLRLTQAEAHVLAFLAEYAPCSINDLHHSFGHKRSTLTSLLDRLESRRWIRRTAHPTSRRLVQVELTDSGGAVAARVSAAVHGLEERLQARVGPEDAATFLRVLQALEGELQ
jgi:DNA-binding MarR family transcriptional regulator